MLIFVKYYTLFRRVLTCYNRGMMKKDLAANFVIRHDNREDFKHSSGYAKVQSGNNFGAASTASFEARKAMEERRKFVRGYKASNVGAARYSGMKPIVYRREEDVIKREKPDVATERSSCYNKRHGGSSSDG